MRWFLLLGVVGCGGRGLTAASGPPGWQLGLHGSVSIESVYTPAEPFEVADLAFDPTHDHRLWVVLQRIAPAEGPSCTAEEAQAGAPGCLTMGGLTATIDAPGTDDAVVTVIEDINSWHFMRRTIAMAMGEGTGFWASCGDFWTANFTDQPGALFMGPMLWSSDLALHGAPVEPTQNGNHYDSLYGTPWCTGIAWEKDNVYWALNGELGALDRVDFNRPHAPGDDDHGDASYARYAVGVGHLQGVPSHMKVSGRWLYVADAANQRVVRLDIESGTRDGSAVTVDAIDVDLMEGATFETVVASTFGLERPSGLEVYDDVLFVSDFATGVIHAFELDGTPLGDLDVSDVAATPTGLAIGPEGWLYFADMVGGAVYRVEAEPPSQ